MVFFKKLINKLFEMQSQHISKALNQSNESQRENYLNILNKLEAIRIHTWLSKEHDQTSLLSSCLNNDGRYNDPKTLTFSYAQVYSQNGEDGYIAEIFSRIGEKSRTFLEIGVENGLQNTTRFLLENGWSGVWVEGDETYYNEAKKHFADYINNGQLKIIHAFVEPNTINEKLDEHEVQNSFDYISVDVDMNTSHIWRALNRKSRVSCIEYNASIPYSLALEVPYEKGAIWDGSNHYGASLKTLELIGLKKGLNLVGCDFQGVNAFFVNSDELNDKFRKPFTSKTHYESPRYSSIEHLGHPPAKTARNWKEPLEMKN